MSVASEEIVETSTFERRIEKPRPYVLNPALEGGRLRGRIEITATCQTERVDMVVHSMRRHRVWVAKGGGPTPMTTFGIVQIAAGLVMPLATPICFAAGCDGTDLDPNTALRTAMIGGAIAGSVLAIGGLVDIIAGLPGNEETWREAPIEEHTTLGPPKPCPRGSPPRSTQAVLHIETATAAVSLADSGAFEVDLVPMAESILGHPDATWRVVLPNGSFAPVDISEQDRFQLKRRLDAYPD